LLTHRDGPSRVLTTFPPSATLSSPDATSFSGAPIIGSCNFNRAYPQLTVTGTADIGDIGVLSVKQLQTDPPPTLLPPSTRDDERLAHGLTQMPLKPSSQDEWSRQALASFAASAVPILT
jgi:hypothetical protein